MRNNRWMTATALASAALFVAAPGFAQTGGGDVQEADNLNEQLQGDDAGQEVIVTGSRISRPDLTSPVPVTVIGAADIQADAALNIQDTLNQLPQFGVGTTRTNSNFSTSGNGVATLNLRSLGANRTLVLVNGRRHIAGFAGSSSVDVNNIPTDFIERIDVVTGGASSVYGSEAIAGVVNFIMKDRIEGVQVRGQAGITDQGDNGRYLLSVSGGTTAFGDSLRVIGNFTYDRDEGLRSNQRSRSAEDCGTPLGAAAGIICGPQSYSIFAPQGQYFFNVLNAQGRPALGSGVPSFSFDRNNNVVLGQGAGFNRNDERFISVPVERFLTSVNATYDISPSTAVFLEASYNKVRSRSSLEPSAVALGFIGTQDAIPIALDNPFIPTQIRTIIAARNSDANPANDVVSITGARRFNEVFDRSNRNDRDTFRAVAGIRGELGTWRWDASYVYGRFEDFTSSETVDTRRLDEAIDAVSLNGQIVCRSATARAAGCVPLNPFGFGTISPAASTYVRAGAVQSLSILNEQHVGSVNVTGSPFALWAGDVGVAVGAEYRKEISSSDWDDLTNAGLGLGNQAGDSSGRFDVWEGYGEVSLPLIRDSFINELTVNGAVRYSHYSTIGGVLTWNAGAELEPFSGLRFRGVYARANRAPNISELFSPANETFATIADPCDGVTATNNPGVTATFPNGFGAVCRQLPAVQAAIAGGGAFNYTLAQSQQINGFVGGNPDLQEETANTLTLGGVLTPAFAPGFSFTADYYSIKLRGAITTLGRQFTVNQCLQSGDPVFCSQVIRDSNTGRILTVNGQLINAARTDTEGLDFVARYGRAIGGDRVDLSINYTLLLNWRSQANPAAPIVENVPVASLSKHRVFGRIGYRTESGFGVSWQTNFMSRAVSSVTFANANPAIEALNDIPAYSYHDLQLRWDVGADRRHSVFFGVDNVFDAQPPFLPSPPFTASITGTETQADVYDPFGRRFYVGFRVGF